MLKKGIKKVFALLLIFTLMFQVFPVFYETQAVSTQLSKTKLTIYIGETKTIRLRGLASSNKKKVVWSSSKESVATVSGGVITAKKKGTTVIKAKYKGKTYKCKVTVKKSDAYVLIRKTSLTVKKGKTRGIWVYAVDVDQVTCDSNNDCVDFKWGKWDGDTIRLKITGVSVGTTTLTVHDTDNSTIKDTIKIKVVAN